MKKILIIDDDEAVLEVLEEILRYDNFEVVTLLRTDNICQDIGYHQPDVLLLDYLLKGIDGNELCRLVKSNPETMHVPVIIFSAYPRRLAPSEYRCDAFIEKPFDLTYLLSVIQEFTQRPKELSSKNDTVPSK